MEINTYAELLKLYREPVYFMLLKMMNNPDDAEDLTMEAFGKAFSNLEKYSQNMLFPLGYSGLQPIIASIICAKKTICQNV